MRTLIFASTTTGHVFLACYYLRGPHVKPSIPTHVLSSFAAIPTLENLLLLTKLRAVYNLHLHSVIWIINIFGGKL